MVRGLRHWWKRVIATGSIGLIALMLCACVDVKQQSVINNDLTGTTTVRIGISKLLIQTLTSASSSLGGTPTPGIPALNSSDLFADTKKQITDMGGTATDYETSDFVGVDATLPFRSLDEMVSQINNLLGSGGGRAVPVAPAAPAAVGLARWSPLPGRLRPPAASASTATLIRSVI